MIEPAFRVGDEFFATEEEAMTYLEERGDAERLERFIRSREWPRGGEARARSVVWGFIQFESETDG